MIKLNNKGMTMVEVLLCFVLVVIITTSMFATLTSYKSKEQLESDRSQIIKYKNLLTKEIQDDLIKRKVVSATIDKKTPTSKKDEYTINIIFKDKTRKKLTIKKYIAAYSTESISVSNDIDDYFMITYDGINYPLPTLGYSKNQNNKTIYDLKLNNIDINTDNNILTIYIGFYHPNFGTRYAIDIVCPLNYM